MKRAAPADLRKSLITAQDLAKAGVDFVVMPVLNEQDRVALLAQQVSRLAGLLSDSAPADEQESKQ
ncbi:hypothetical protein EYC51_16855 [Alcaligenes faecalis]|jgi:hypothetical protein|nr:hypothetical protein EYC51_16855 [Alcaligenes faecalis]